MKDSVRRAKLERALRRESANEDAMAGTQTDDKPRAVVEPWAGSYIVLPLDIAERSGLSIVGIFK